MTAVPRAIATPFDLELPDSRRPDLARLEQRVERFCSSGPLSERSVVFHSTGVNYAHQFYVLGLLGRERLRRFRAVHFVSGSVIAAIVYYSFKTGNLQYGRGDAERWEQQFFAHHGLSPLRSAVRVPYRLARGLPILSHRVQMEVIRAGIGKEFGDRPVECLPSNFRFWLYDQARGKLMCATADNHLGFLPLVQLAVAATAVPRLFDPFEVAGFRFVDPVFSPGRRLLPRAWKDEAGPTLVSNMVVERGTRSGRFLRPHPHPRGRMLMLRELLQFCLGVSNRDHLEGLETGLGVLGSRLD